MKVRPIFYHQLRGSAFTLLLTITVITSVIYYFSEKILLRTIEDGLQYQADFRKDRIQAIYQDDLKWLAAITKDEHFSALAENLLSAYGRPDGIESLFYSQAEDELLENYHVKLQAQGVEDLLLLNPDGELVFSSQLMLDDIGEQMGESGVYGDTIFSEMVETALAKKRLVVSRYGWVEQIQSKAIFLAQPLHSDFPGIEEQFVGLVVRPLSMERLSNLFQSYSGLGSTGEIVIAQNRGQSEQGVTFVSQFRNDTYQPDEECVALRVNEPNRFGMVQALTGETGAGWGLNYECEEVYAVWMWIPGLQWGMVVAKDRGEIMMPIHKLRQNLRLGSVIILLLLLWVVHRQSRTLAYPLEQLNRSTKKRRIHQQPLTAVQEVNNLTSSLQGMVTELEEALDTAEKANHAKSEFLASMSHELRTPLTTIIGNSQIMTSNLNTARVTDLRLLQELSSTIEMAGKHQLVLVNDILDMSKLESGKFGINEISYDLSTLLQDTERMLRARAEEAGLELTFDQKSGEPHLLVGDAYRIGQILINLTSNAIKFTQQGWVLVTIHRSGEQLCFTVEDSGIGMSADVLTTLFKRFEQADGSISRRYGGSGLGLYISRSLAELMEGSLEASSEKGKGSRFELRLPYKPTETPVTSIDIRRQTERGIGERLSGAVLVAEDTPELQLLERRILEAVGLTVTVVSNGKEAVSLATERPFDLILMDVQMPIMNGIEATKELRSKGSTTPIIALTANVMQEHRDQFSQAGGDDFVGKPINKQELIKAITPFFTVNSETEGDDSQRNKRKALKEVVWSESYSVGHTSMDMQHQILVGYINELIRYDELQLGGESHSKMLIILEKLNSYIETHFHSEELLLSIIDYPKLTEHLQEHDEFREKISWYYKGEMGAKELRSLTEYLLNWLICHILTEDMAYKDYVTESDESGIEATERAALSESMESTEPEVDDELMGVFRESATRNRKLLVEALENQDWSAVKEVAHQVKGSGSSFGFSMLTEKAKDVCDVYDNDELADLSDLTRILVDELDKTLS